MRISWYRRSQGLKPSTPTTGTASYSKVTTNSPLPLNVYTGFLDPVCSPQDVPAHRIRTRGSKLHQSALTISKRAHCRWCLTGTPIHNSLDDYGALLGFLQAPKLSEKRDFDKLIVQHMKDKPQDGLARLQDLVRATCLRRTISGLGAATLHLPPRKIKPSGWIWDPTNSCTRFSSARPQASPVTSEREAPGAPRAPR